jgi:hypothetical protein
VNVGYLSRLRILSEYRNTTLLARGYRYLKELHQDKRTPFYITTIIEDNAYSLNMLTKRRAGLPFYLEWGLYYTALIKPIRKKEDIKDGFSVIRGSLSYLDEIIEFLNRHGSKKQFFPYYSKEDLNANNEALKDLEIGDFYIAIKGGKIVGILATWDQNKFKQTVIAGYKGKTRLLKPLYNMYAKIGGWPQFPPSGTFLNVIYISFIAIEENNQDVFRVLLREAYNNNVGDRNAYILVGLHSRDPLWKVVQEYAHLEYKGRLFIVCWEDGQEVYKSLDGRIPYLELATL